MAKDRARLLSGRIKTKRGSELDPRRIDYLSLDNAEPNLGNPDSDLYVVASLADGNRVFLKFNQGFTVSADSVSGDEATFEIDPSGLVHANGTTLAEVLDDLDSAISEAFLSGVYHDSNFNGAGTIDDVLSLDSNLNIFSVNVSDTADINQATVATLDVTDSATIADLIVDSNANLTHVFVSDLTDNRITIAGTNGRLEDDANLTFNGTQFDIGAGNFTVQQSTGNTAIAGTLDVTDSSTFSTANITQANVTTLDVTDSATIADADITGTATINQATVTTLDVTDSATIVDASVTGTAVINQATVTTLDVSDSATIADANVTGTAVINQANVTTLNATTFDVTDSATIADLIVDSDANLTHVFVSDLTDNRIVISGPSGKLEDDSNFTFNGTQFDIGGGNFTVQQASGNTQVIGTLDVDAQTTLASANVEDLTNDRLVVAGTNGELEDDANLTYNGSTLTVANSTASTSSASGALVVTGGVGIGGALNVDGNTEINGDLTVTGTTTTIDVQTLSISDPMIHLADGNETSDEVDIGFIGHYYDAGLGGRQHTGLFRDATDDKYYLFAQYQDSALDSTPRSNIIDINDSSFVLADINVKEVFADRLSGTVLAINADSIFTHRLTVDSSVDFSDATVDIDAGTIDGTTIGDSNPAAGTFTNLARTSPIGVTAGAYGSVTAIPVIDVDSSGFIDSIATVAISTTLNLRSDSTDSGSVSLLDSELSIISGVDITTSVSGTTYTITHDASGVTVGTYGSASQIPIFTVDSQGHIDSATSVAVSDTLRLLSDSTDSGSVSLLDSELTISGGTDITTSVSGTTYTITHDLSGVTAGTYGSASQIPILVIDSQGHVDSATTVAVSDTLRLISDADSGSVSLLDSELSINEGEGINIGLVGTVFTVSGEDATVTNKGIASFDSTDFVVTGGAVSLATDITIDSSLQVDTLTVTDSATIADLDVTTLTVTDSATIADLDVTTLTIVDSATIGGNLTFVDSDDLIMPDNSRIKLGDNADLQIYHDGSNSYIHDNGTGDLRILGENNVEIGNTSAVPYFRGTNGGASNLFYGGNPKLATTATGINVTGEVTADSATISGNFTVDSGTLYVDATNNRVGIGTTTPARILHTETTDYIVGRFDRTAGGNAYLSISDASTTDEGYVAVGATGNDLKFRSGNLDRAALTSTGDFGIGTTSPSKKLHVVGEAQIDSDLTLGGDVFIGDNQKINIGASNDLQIYHDGQHSYIVDSGSGQLRLRSSAAMVFQNFDGSKGYATFTDGQDVKLYYNGGERFATTATGVQIKSNALIDSNLTIGGYLRGPSNLIIDPADYDSVTGTVTILGNLQVDGTTTTINSTTLTVDDKNIVIASGSTNATASDSAGITIDLGSNGEATILYKSGDDEFKFNKGVDIAGTLTVDSVYSVDISIGQLNDVDLTAGNGLVDEYLLKYNAATGNFEMEQEATLAVAISGHAVPLSLLDSIGRAGTELTSPLGVGSPVYYDSDAGLWTGAYRSDSDVASHVIIKYNSTDSEFNIASSGVFTLDSNGSAPTLDTNSYYYLGDSAGIGTPNNPNSGLLQALYYAVDSNKVDLNIAEAVTLDIGTTDLEQYPNISQGQTVLNLAKTINTAQTDLFKNGVLLREGASYDYVINSSTQITLNDSLDDSDLVNVRSNVNTASTGIAATSLETFTVTDTATTVIAYFSATASNAAKFVVSANDGTDTEITELLIAHDGTTAVATEYGQVSTGSSLATYNVTLVGTNVNLTATLPTASATNFKIFKTLL